MCIKKAPPFEGRNWTNNTQYRKRNQVGGKSYYYSQEIVTLNDLERRNSRSRYFGLS